MDTFFLVLVESLLHVISVCDNAVRVDSGLVYYGPFFSLSTLQRVLDSLDQNGWHVFTSSLWPSCQWLHRCYMITLDMKKFIQCGVRRVLARSVDSTSDFMWLCLFVLLAISCPQQIGGHCRREDRQSLCKLSSGQRSWTVDIPSTHSLLLTVCDFLHQWHKYT